jgi:hypothetical protein
MSKMHPNDRLAISRGIREYFDSRTDEEIEAHRKRMQIVAINREANYRLNPDPSRNRGHRFQKGNTYALGNGDPNGEGMLVARTLKQLAYEVYRNNPRMIYDAIVTGVQSEPPRSLPYLMLLLKVEADLDASAGMVNAAWVDYLTPGEHEELRAIMASPALQRIMSAAKQRMAGHPQAPADIVIDLPPAPQGTSSGDSGGGGGQ